MSRSPMLRRSAISAAPLAAIAAFAVIAPHTRASAFGGAASTPAVVTSTAGSPTVESPAESPGVTSSTAVAPALAATPRVTTTRVATGLVSPVLVRSANDGTARLFVVEQAGRVRVVSGGRITGTYLDIRSLVRSGGEQGMLGLAFAPDFAKSHLLWVTYTRGDGALVLARFTAASTTSPNVSTGTRRTILVVPHPLNTNHNGGNIAFGPDGYLYLGTGDGGGSGDPANNAQNLRRLLGKMLRLNVRCAGHLYCRPASNPWATSTKYRHEIWMWGLRNPWRWSFDTNGTLYIGDVGQYKYEEIDIVPASRQKGANLGWTCREANHVFNSARCNSQARYLAPTLEICHVDVRGCPLSIGAEAVIGGYVYRGTAKVSARGTYVYGDYVTGRVWAYRGGVRSLPTALAGVSGFGTGNDREIYAVTLRGGLYRIGFTGA